MKEITFNILIVTGIALGLYHVLVEWQWIAAPQGCATPDFSGASSIDEIYKIMHNNQYAPCDNPQFVILGLSLSEINVMAMIMISATRRLCKIQR